MNPTTFKFRWHLQGKHVHVDVFAGDVNYTLANIGHLVFDRLEFHIFKADHEKLGVTYIFEERAKEE